MSSKAAEIKGVAERPIETNVSLKNKWSLSYEQLS